MVGIDHYIVGIFFASLLGFLLLFSLLRRKRKKDRCSSAGFQADFVWNSHDGEVRPDQRPDTDVIIVGAGVAGAALAFTIGKVIENAFKFSLFFNFAWFIVLFLFMWLNSVCFPCEVAALNCVREFAY